ncbi:hypothetical protein BJV82DRAFT_603030 [Fennellomyces sp. T-0311]|nr:hypothetical protein BJV82DRAFT_603030 [Fennellomyces sp. T-0311]
MPLTWSYYSPPSIAIGLIEIKSIKRYLKPISQLSLLIFIHRFTVCSASVALVRGL